MVKLIELLKKYEERNKELKNTKTKIIEELSSSLEKILPEGIIPRMEGIHFNSLKEKLEKKYRGIIPSYYIKEALNNIKGVLEDSEYYLIGRKIIIKMPLTRLLK